MTPPIVDLFRIALHHRGDRAAILAELEAEKGWARLCARHRLPRDTGRPGPAVSRLHPEGRSPNSSIVDEAPNWEAAGPVARRPMPPSVAETGGARTRGLTVGGIPVDG